VVSWLAAAVAAAAPAAAPAVAPALAPTSATRRASDEGAPAVVDPLAGDAPAPAVVDPLAGDVSAGDVPAAAVVGVAVGDTLAVADGDVAVVGEAGVGEAGVGGGGVEVVGFGGGTGVGSGSSLTAPLNSRMPRPSAPPISPIRPAPKMTSTITRMMISSVGPSDTYHLDLSSAILPNGRATLSLAALLPDGAHAAWYSRAPCIEVGSSARGARMAVTCSGCDGKLRPRRRRPRSGAGSSSCGFWSRAGGCRSRLRGRVASRPAPPPGGSSNRAVLGAHPRRLRPGLRPWTHCGATNEGTLGPTGHVAGTARTRAGLSWSLRGTWQGRVGQGGGLARQRQCTPL
jgi:hypothetical protein